MKDLSWIMILPIGLPNYFTALVNVVAVNGSTFPAPAMYNHFFHSDPEYIVWMDLLVLYLILS